MYVNWLIPPPDTLLNRTPSPTSATLVASLQDLFGDLHIVNKIADATSRLSITSWENMRRWDTLRSILKDECGEEFNVVVDRFFVGHHVAADHFPP